MIRMSTVRYILAGLLVVGPLMMLSGIGVVALGSVAGATTPATSPGQEAAGGQSERVYLEATSLFPILVPGLLASVKATGLIMHGDPMGQIQSWNLLLMGIASIYWMLCTLMFPRVVEE